MTGDERESQNCLSMCPASLSNHLLISKSSDKGKCAMIAN